MTRKSIKVTEIENGHKYFTIYEVRVKKLNGEVVVHDRYLNEKDAEKAQEFVYEHLNNLYTCAYIIEEIVWC